MDGVLNAAAQIELSINATGNGLRSIVDRPLNLPDPFATVLQILQTMSDFATWPSTAADRAALFLVRVVSDPVTGEERAVQPVATSFVLSAETATGSAALEALWQAASALELLLAPGRYRSLTCTWPVFLYSCILHSTRLLKAQCGAS